MKKDFRSKGKFIALLLAVIMIASVFPFVAIANGEHTGPEQDSSACQIVKTGGESTYEDDAVKVSKVIRPSDVENEFYIDLTVTTTDAVDEDYFQKAHAAVVVAIDISSSMDYCIKCGASRNNSHAKGCEYGTGNVTREQTRMYAAVEAAKDFLKQFRIADATLGEKRFASLVFFGTSAKRVVDWTDITNCVDTDAAFKKFTDELVYNNTTAKITLQGGTFTQGGLLVARNLYNTENAPKVDGSVIKNRFVVLLTDGDPNCRVNSDNENIYINSYNKFDIPSTATTDPQQNNQYFAANRPSVVAAAGQIKTGVKTGDTVITYNADVFTIAFQTSGGFDIGNVSYPSASKWLETVASDPTYAYTAGKAIDLKLSFDEIMTSIRYLTQAWHVFDPMAANIEFLGVVDTDEELISNSGTQYDGRNFYNFGPDEKTNVPTINWNLLTSKKFSDDKITRVFVLTYMIRIDNITTPCYGDNRHGVFTNGRTYLTYKLATVETVDGIDGEPIYKGDMQEADFCKIPKVRTFSDNLTFTKIGKYTGKPLAGYKFDLMLGNVKIDTATSDSKGVVSFTNIPSGHDYTLVECSKVNPFSTLYSINSTIVDVKVAYGSLTSEAMPKLDDGRFFVNPAKDVPVDLIKYFRNEDGSLSAEFEDILLCNLEAHTHTDECYSEAPAYCELPGVHVIGSIVEPCDCERVLESKPVYCEFKHFHTEDCEAECAIEVDDCDGKCIIDTKQEWTTIHIEGCTGEKTTPVYCNGDCVIGTTDLICEKVEHEHDASCFINNNLTMLEDDYTFWFTITNKNGTWSETKALTLSRDDIVDLCKNKMPYEAEAFFTIPAAQIGNGPFAVTEAMDMNGGWTLPKIGCKINLDNIASGQASALLVNNYGTEIRPWFTISKDLRTIRPDSKVSTDTFYFNLYSDAEKTNIVRERIPVTESKGWKELVELKEYINANDVTLYLEEVYEENEKIDGMEYSTDVYEIRINGGIATVRLLGANESVEGGTDALFVNFYYEPRTPDFSIVKIVTQSGTEAPPSMTFNFTWNAYIYREETYENEGNTPVAEGTAQILNTGRTTVNLSDFEGYDFTNFTGYIVISEINEGSTYWAFDRNVYTLEFTGGEFYGNQENAIAEVTFVNVYNRTPPPPPPPDPDYGTLIVTKQFSGIDSIPSDWTATIYVTGPNSYSRTSTISAANLTATFGTLDAGTYTVTEVGPSNIPNYTFVSVTGEGSYNVTAPGTTYVTITNTYSADPDVIIETSEPPLASFEPPVIDDYEETEFDEEVPLSDMPQTGINEAPIVLIGIGLCASLMALGSLVFITMNSKKKGKDNN